MKIIRKTGEGIAESKTKTIKELIEKNRHKLYNVDLADNLSKPIGLRKEKDV